MRLQKLPSGSLLHGMYILPDTNFQESSLTELQPYREEHESVPK